MIDVKYLIVGAGPAGVQLGYYLQQGAEDYLIVERGPRAGTFFDVFPRHRKLISINKRFTGSEHPDFNMRHDWNSLLTEALDFRFTDYDEDYFPSADNLTSYINDFSARYSIRIAFDTDIVSVSYDGHRYIAKARDGRTFRSPCLIVGTGLSKPLIPDIPGIEHTENYCDMSVDLKDFEAQRVLIIGKGNSGFETADHLVPAASVIHIVSPESLNMAWKTHYVGHLRAINNNFLDTYQLKSQNAVIDADVRCIEKTSDGRYSVTFAYKHAEGEVEALSYDRILCCAGFKVDEDIFAASARPKLGVKGKYPALTAEFESVNRPNMFFAGTLTHSLDFRKTTSGFIHGFRYNAHALHKILTRRFDAKALPEETFEACAEELSRRVLGRANVSGALWQQPGFLADYFYFDEGQVRYGNQLPLEYIRNFVAGASRSVFAVTLEYGDPIVGDPFCVERIHRENVKDASQSQFLHPVIRYFSGSDCVAEHHVLEDLESRWEESVHIEPLAEFLSSFVHEHASQQSVMAQMT